MKVNRSGRTSKTMLIATCLLFAAMAVSQNSDDVNYDNLRRFMSQSPQDLAVTLHLLENPYVAAALVENDRKPATQTAVPVQEESNKLLDFLLSHSGKKYPVQKPANPLVPPSVDLGGVENDPLLGSFFVDAKEYEPPLEKAKNSDATSLRFVQPHDTKAGVPYYPNEQWYRDTRWGS